MGHKQFKYGDLNPATHPQTGRSLDPEAFTGAGNLTEAARQVNEPAFLDKLGFPLKGIVLRVESSAEGNLEPSTTSDEGWGAWGFNPAQGVPQLWRCRVRVPEIHAHLPIPETFGPEGLSSIMVLYPEFQAKDQSVSAPVVGEICYVDFGDRKRFEDPIFLGMVKDSGRPVEGGASSTDEGRGAADSANANDNNLNSDPPPGDSPGSGEVDINGQTPVDAPVPPNPNDIECTNTRNPTANRPPSCAPFVDNGPGLYPTAARGRDTGEKEMDEWVNRQARNVLVLAASKHTLQLMEEAFIEETGITDVDVKKFINSGYRNLALQECARAKYDACVKEWKRQGGRFPGTNGPQDPGAKTDQQPNPVARPGFSKHNSGAAVDFNADGTGRSKRTRTTALWVWLQANSRRFGWVNPSWARNNPAEPWHFEFNEVLARSLGLFPRPGVTDTVAARQ